MNEGSVSLKDNIRRMEFVWNMKRKYGNTRENEPFIHDKTA